MATPLVLLKATNGNTGGKVKQESIVLFNIKHETNPEQWAGGKSPALYQGPHGGWRLTTEERKRILLNNIYGADIDHQAVEVTKLSLLLKVLQGEDERGIGAQLPLFHERVLPDLRNNLKCGIALIGPDFYDKRQPGR